MSHHVVEARSLCYDYPDGTPALRDVSFRITHGQAVAIAAALSLEPSVLALDVCSRVILLDRGAVAADGPAVEVLNDAALLQRRGLEKPLRLQACPRCSGPARGWLS